MIICLLRIDGYKCLKHTHALYNTVVVDFKQQRSQRHSHHWITEYPVYDPSLIHLYLFVFLTLPSYRNSLNRPSIFLYYNTFIYTFNSTSKKRIRTIVMFIRNISIFWLTIHPLNGGRYVWRRGILMRYYLTFSFSFKKSDNWLYPHICICCIIWLYCWICYFWPFSVAYKLHSPYSFLRLTTLTRFNRIFELIFSPSSLLLGWCWVNIAY